MQTTIARDNNAAPLPFIQVTLQYAPAIRAVPGELVARRRGDNARAQCDLAIVADDEFPFEVASAADADWYAVVNQGDLTGVTASRHTLSVEIDTEKWATDAGESVREIVLTTTHPKLRELRVPVRVLVE